jgi:23S rRNA pseudouridine1911/1915/1917 synthase
MNQIFKFIVNDEETDLRIDKFLAIKFHELKPEITRSKIQNIIKEGLIRDQNGNIINDCSYRVKINQEINVSIPKPKNLNLVAKKIDFEIIYEDEDLIVINKPDNLTVHPGSGNNENTLVNSLLFSHQNKLSTINGEFRPGIVHRLDKDTSGLMLVAKNDLTHQILSNMLKERIIKRSYLAFIYGVMEPKKGVIHGHIIRNRHNRLKMSVTKNTGRVAITNYQTKEIFLNGFCSLIECTLETGRTHQIRAHLEYQKHSLIGDQLYNSCQKNVPNNASEKLKNFLKRFTRQALHSYKISFEHPRTKKEISFEIPLPSDLQTLQKHLENG